MMATKRHKKLSHVTSRISRAPIGASVVSIAAEFFFVFFAANPPLRP